MEGLTRVAAGSGAGLIREVIDTAQCASFVRFAEAGTVRCNRVKGPLLGVCE